MTNVSIKTLAQTEILAAAAKRRNRSVLPLPTGHELESAKTKKLLKSMLRTGLIEERQTKSDRNVWRTEDGMRYQLLLTEAGLSATQAGEFGPPSVSGPTGEGSTAPTSPIKTSPDAGALTLAPDTSKLVPTALAKPAPGGKLGEVLSAVQSEAGASLACLIELTGWQPHTVRASLTRLRQRGVLIQLGERAGEKVYTAMSASSGGQHP